ncbi:hypothetical protein [Corynebacterium mayonis]|uniref:hypothetical protein n=1 Tax=Corynebacterium mayonis TaxID=3062461 RepID=UPI00314022AF
METFALDPGVVDKLTAQLRDDAFALLPVTCPPVPAVGPLAAFAAAFGAAVAAVNDRAAALQREAQRLADVMDTTSTATQRVDTGLSGALAVLRL